MASYLPPTEDLPIFDNQVFTSNDTALTYTEAKKYFVTYPSAQGTSTITDFITGIISYLSPASGSFFDIGTNQVSGGTIRIGPTGGSAGVSVHCGNIDFKNNTINNATSGTTGTLTICDAQTSGILNLGIGARTKSSGTSEGNINIGTGNNTIVSGTAPPQINIGSNTAMTNVTRINIGGTSTTTTMSGASTTITSGGLSFRTANNILGETTGGVYSLFNNLIAGGTLAIGGAGATTVNGSLSVVGLLTADGGLTLNTGDLLTANGSIKTTSITSDGIMGITSATAMTIGATSGALSISSGSTIGINCTNSSALSLGTSGTTSVGIGSSGVTTTNNGLFTSTELLTANGGISMGAGKGIVLSPTSYTPSSTQLGYTSSVTNPSAITLTSSTLTNFLGTGVTLPKGVCLMTFVCTATFTPASSASSMTMSFNESSGVTLTSLTADTSLIMVGNSTKTTFMFTCIMVNTNYANSGEITWQVTPSGTTTNVSVITGDAKISWVKIA
jgi:hypothetical protein